MKLDDVKPVRKVSAVVLAGALVTILVWVWELFSLPEPPAPVVAGLTTLVAFAAGWLVPGVD